LYLISFILFWFKHKKNKIDFNQKFIIIDTFFLVDKIIAEEKFEDRYFLGLYDVFEKHNTQYIFLPRLYGMTKNPLKIFGLLNILNKNKHIFLFEYQLLSVIDLIKIFFFIVIYPFKTIKLLQRDTSHLDQLFNYEIINTLSSTPFTAYIRYLVGKKLSEKLSNDSKIISWQEFQNLEKTLNKAIKESNSQVKIYGCEFLIQYKDYISMHMNDIDYELNITPHVTFLNGKYNYNLSKKQLYENGVSLRYKNIFSFDKASEDSHDMIALLSYEIDESVKLLKLVGEIDEKIKIKIHPATKKNQFLSYLNSKMEFTDSDIYSLLRSTKIVFVAPMSGTALEAVACGVSVIIIASQDNLTANPLIEYGKGKIWDVAFTKDDVKILYNQLIEYRKNNLEEINEIASWYKNNFFIEPTEENIIKVFELNIKKD
jgi:hypothetical protein